MNMYAIDKAWTYIIKLHNLVEYSYVEYNTCM